MSEQGPLSGQVLGGKYRLGALLGQGGFGAVYQAEEQVLQRPQAIKVLLEERFSDARFRERFLREARTLGALDHAHIVHVDDLGAEGHLIYLVMPLISGGTFQDVLKARSGPLGLDETTRYLEAICSALDYAHAQGVVHLDLKPLNLLVHQDGRLLLSDFGLAHLLEQGAVAGGTSLQFGSPLYMAPEHFEGQPETRSDLYAVGLILYQMLTGKHPFEASTPAALMRKHLMEPPPSLAQVRPDLPASLDAMLAKALAKQPAQRYQTAAALLVGFKMAVAGQGIQPLGDASTLVKPVSPSMPAGLLAAAGPPRLAWEEQPTVGSHPLPAPGPQMPRQFSRRKLLVGLGAGTVGLAALGGGAFVLSKRGGAGSASNPAEGSPTLLYSVKDDPDSNFVGWSWSPDGTRLARLDFKYGDPEVDTVQVWDVQARKQIANWSDKEPEVYLPPEEVGGIGWIDNAPCVAWVGTSSEDLNIHFLNLITQQEIGVFPYSSSDYIGISGVYWVPEGGRVAIIEDVLDRPGTVHIWDVIENREICSFVEPAPLSQTFGGAGNGVWDFRWSPDGKQFLVWGQNGILYVVDAQTGAQITRYRKHYDEHINDDTLLGVPINCVAWSPNGKFIATNAGAISEDLSKDDSAVHVWSALDGTQQCVYQGGRGLGLELASGVGAVAWSEDSSMLVTAGRDAAAYIWDAMSGAPIFTSSAADHPPFLAWSPLGARIASGPTGGATNVVFKVWNARDGKDVVEYKAHTDRGAGQLLWSPNGKLMAVMADSSLQIWEGGH